MLTVRSMQTQDHWTDIGRRIAGMGPPQVPGLETTEQINAICGGCQGLTVLFGVTPAYAALGSRLLAFDSSPGMISAVWPGNDARRRAEVADWVALPVATASAQQVLGDGALNSVPSRTVLRAVLGEVRRILHPEGRAVFRVFARPAKPETVGEVLQTARNGGIESLNTLRWRIASALAIAPDHQVNVADILAAAESLGDLADFAAARGMDPDQARHFHAYRGSSASYVFPDRPALVEDAQSAGLACEWVETQGYPGARDCPLAVMQPVA